MSHTTDLWSGWCREQVESIDARLEVNKRRLIEKTTQEFIKSQDIYADYMRRYSDLVSQYQHDKDPLSATTPSDQHITALHPSSRGSHHYFEYGVRRRRNSCGRYSTYPWCRSNFRYV